jgi:hypothetical protein
VHESVNSNLLTESEERGPLLGVPAGLQHNRLAEWVVTVHKPVVALIQMGDEARHRNCPVLTSVATIAVHAYQN